MLPTPHLFVGDCLRKHDQIKLASVRLCIQPAAEAVIKLSACTCGESRLPC